MQQEPEPRERPVVRRDQHPRHAYVLLSLAPSLQARSTPAWPRARTVPPDAKKINYRRPGFFEKFWELQGVMWQTNQGLTDRHAYDSRPHSWPLLLRGINLCVLSLPLFESAHEWD